MSKVTVLGNVPGGLGPDVVRGDLDSTESRNILLPEAEGIKHFEDGDNQRQLGASPTPATVVRRGDIVMVGTAYFGHGYEHPAIVTRTYDDDHDIIMVTVIPDGAEPFPLGLVHRQKFFAAPGAVRPLLAPGQWRAR